MSNVKIEERNYNIHSQKEKGNKAQGKHL